VVQVVEVEGTHTTIRVLLEIHPQQLPLKEIQVAMGDMDLVMRRGMTLVVEEVALLQLETMV
tara:strand:+ start:215 stop:400 length:186 start_codon:yes stop_codon:yes gene_type:complete